MATVAQSNFDFQLVALKSVDMPGLEALLDEQCAEWLELLNWDYSGPSRLIKEVARARELPGYVVTSSSAAIGFGYYTVEPGRCSIGDVFITKAWRGVGADRALMSALLDDIDSVARIRRTESQCVSVDNDAADTVLRKRGFSMLERDYMTLDLNRRAGLMRPGRSAGLKLRKWHGDDFAQAARIIHRSYRGEHDSLINSQYRTEEGCAELLSVLTDHIWCGEFLPQVSRVAIGPGGTVAAVLIASRIGPDTGHLAQISVHPAHQNRGVGRRMICEAIGELRRLGYQKASLAVTASNAQACHLYESCGFEVVHRFPVYYRDAE
jgi:ribosomal protein S18 acetylase RimI-like enzyme